MARESKRKRDEKRFGKPERLADSVIDSYGQLSLDETGAMWPRRRLFADTVADSHVIEATNVSDYFLETSLEKGFTFIDNLPCMAPPFQLFFVEMTQKQLGGLKAGWLFAAFGDGRVKDSLVGTKFYAAEVPKESYKWFILATCVARSGSGTMIGPIADAEIFVDESGRLIDSPMIHFLRNGEFSDDNMRITKKFASYSLAASCLAICFMNCSGVSLEDVQSDPVLNRERRKAGMKPFMRYRTININPMKQALKTDGGIDTNGLKKALHICRGHFATYSDSFMGRPLEKPVTMWRPSHVRGSVNQGIVTSDYKVSPPAQAS